MAESSKNDMGAARVRLMAFGTVYPLYVKKAERKGRTRDEVDAVISWMTGYDRAALPELAARGVDFEAFFAGAPGIDPGVKNITGVVCGVRVEEVEDPVLRDVRRLDKLIDELARGRPLEKILSR